MFASPRATTIQAMPAPTLGCVPDHLRGLRGGSNDLPKKEGQARYHLTNLNYHIGNAHNNYATGTWGYTVLRTVYAPESDALFLPPSSA